MAEYLGSFALAFRCCNINAKAFMGLQQAGRVGSMTGDQTQLAGVEPANRQGGPSG